MSTTHSEIHITFIIGAPGSGKGTLCKALKEEKGYCHISVGDYLRELSNSTVTHGPQFGPLDRNTLRQFLTTHQLVPAKDIVDILWYKIASEKECGAQKFLIDGFPRDEGSADLFEHHHKRPDCVVFLECPKENCQERFLDRKREATDTTGVFEKRYEDFEKKNPFILKKFEKEVLRVDSSGPTEVSKQKLFEALGI